MLSSQSPRTPIKHERQMSMPSTHPLETDSSYFPAPYNSGFNQPSATSHRRGTSLDQSMRPQDSTIDPGTGILSTNQGSYEQQRMRETQMHGLPRPGQFTPLDNIFEDPSTGEQPAKGFGLFGSIGYDDSFGSGFSPTFSPAIPQSIQNHTTYSRPRTPENQILKGKIERSLIHEMSLNEAR